MPRRLVALRELTMGIFFKKIKLPDIRVYQAKPHSFKASKVEEIASCALRRERQFYCHNDGDGKKCGLELCSCVYHGPTTSKAMRLGLDRDRAAFGHGLVERSRRELDAKEAQKSGVPFSENGEIHELLLKFSEVFGRGDEEMDFLQQQRIQVNVIACLSELEDPTDKVALVEFVSATLVIVRKDVVEDCIKCLKLVDLTLRLLTWSVEEDGLEAPVSDIKRQQIFVTCYALGYNAFLEPSKRLSSASGDLFIYNVNKQHFGFVSASGE
ncbi:unnamed protein product [Dovyalis caffra]|uniref:Uncharacterized protein n=1 Tax=Dovyalis caffra TaxID=77055 RepID=A0AAV1R5I3_9ROSI|nr:unnamed protein product [Dovyalis caffra]